MFSLPIRRLVLLAALSAFTGAAQAQKLGPVDQLLLRGPDDCQRIMRTLAPDPSGSQWLVGKAVDFFDRPATRTRMQTLTDAFEKVQCYASADNRVFVSNQDNSICGWVDRSDLLPTNNRTTDDLLGGRKPGSICETPRALRFRTFCESLGDNPKFGSDSGLCKGIPANLRTKAVLTGESSSLDRPRYPFLTAPEGGRERVSKPFFSVLEVHKVATAKSGETLVLVGDGDGDLFGWIDLRAVKLWPTRLGLFFDTEGIGRMFGTERALLSNWFRGTPAPNIVSGGVEKVRAHVNGKAPLLSYPIVRTVTPETDPSYPEGSPSFHEVVFLGQTGDGDIRSLLNQAALVTALENLREVNIMLVIDTTESMTDYLPFVRQGIADFIRDYNRRAQTVGSTVPAARIAVYAYSDFIHASQTRLGSPIRIETLMAPVRVGPGYDVGSFLNSITDHKGLRDEIGKLEEASLEAVAAQAATFSDGNWFAEGPRILIHIGDHGSRSSVDIAAVAQALAANNVHYYPIAVVTDDKGSVRRKEARELFENQAIALLAPLYDRPVLSEDLRRVDLADTDTATAKAVKLAIDLALGEVQQSIVGLREIKIDSELNQAARDATYGASATIKLDERLREQYGLDDLLANSVAVADTGFAPFRMKRNGLEETIDWRYTVALEPSELNFLQESFVSLCSQIGRPEQKTTFRRTIVKLAEAFSGDKVETNTDVLSILSDLQNLPGVRGSFLSRTPGQIIQDADSTDPDKISALKRDVCWITYHLNNVVQKSYAQPNQLAWNGTGFSLKPGAEVAFRIYRYKPLVGAEVYYLPSWFFVAPREISTVQPSEAPCILC